MIDNQLIAVTEEYINQGSLLTWHVRILQTWHYYQWGSIVIVTSSQRLLSIPLKSTYTRAREAHYGKQGNWLQRNCVFLLDFLAVSHIVGICRQTMIIILKIRRVK